MAEGKNLTQKEFFQLANRVQLDKNAGYFGNGAKKWSELEERYGKIIPGKVVGKTHIKKAAEAIGMELNIRRNDFGVGHGSPISTLYGRVDAVATVVKRLADSLQVDSSEINWDLTGK